MNRRGCGLGRTIRGPLASNRNQGDLIRRKDLGPSRKMPKNREVTWCYNRQEDLTLFGSTPVVQHNKLSGRPVGRARCRCEARTRCSDNDRSAMLADLSFAYTVKLDGRFAVSTCCAPGFDLSLAC